MDAKRDSMGWPVRMHEGKRVCAREKCEEGRDSYGRPFPSPEYRVAGYCSGDCEDMHELEQRIVELERDLDALRARISGDNLLDIIGRVHEAIGEDKDSDHESLPDAVAASIRDRDARIADLERERDAYKRAKAENDERFMNERDDARSILASPADRMNTWARENGLREAKRCLSLEDMRNTIDALAHRLAEHRIAREADRFELARLRAAIETYLARYDERAELRLALERAEKGEE